MHMFSKIIDAALQPGMLFTLMVAAGAALLFTRRYRWGRAVIVTALALAVLISAAPVDDGATAWLEERFPIPSRLPERVEGIVVLGGAIDPIISAARRQIALNGAAERLVALIALARLYPDARLVFSGGSGAVFAREHKEADYARAFYRDMGFDVARILFESGSRNTRENAVLSKALAAPRPGETWLLVTSALHMPRAIGSFRAVGWEVVPYPVDYLTTGRLTAASALRFSPVGSGHLGPLLHEAVGLIGYRLRGWTDDLLPAPRD